MSRSFALYEATLSGGTVLIQTKTYYFSVIAVEYWTFDLADRDALI